MTTHREVVSTYNLTILVEYITGRNLRLVLRVCDNLLCKTCSFVGLGTVCDTLDNIIETKCTSILCNDNGIEWVPLGNKVTLLNDVALLEVE